DVLGDRGVVEAATTKARAVVPLVFGDQRRDLGQFRDLVPGGFGIVRTRVGRQRLVAAVAVTGDEGDDLVQALGGQAALEACGMPGLSAGLLTGGLLGDRLGGTGGGGGGRGAGVGGVGGPARGEVAGGRLQVGDPVFQRGDAIVTFQTTRTSHRSHDDIIATRQGGSCASESGERLPQ